MTKVAIIESKIGRTNWNDRFDGAFEFERFALCSDSSKKKILKADVDIEIDTEEYDWVILVGSECLKSFTSANSKRLTKMSKTINSRTYQVTCSEEIEEKWFENCVKVGISAGASTPDYLIDDVATRIENIKK